jgi:4-hydroxy-3-methylbut-2-enyl diphosphate reductase
MKSWRELNSYKKMQVFLAEKSGFCFGVKRAVRLAIQASKMAKQVYTIGPLIHNPQYVEYLQKQGIFPIQSVNDVESGVVVLRSHGVSPDTYIQAKKKGLEVVDATCPNVKRVQALARELKGEGYQVVIVGERRHPEVRSIANDLQDDVLIIGEVDDLRGDGLSKRIGVIAQTTQDLGCFRDICHQLLGLVREMKVYNTICKASYERQVSTIKLAQKTDLLLIVGGRNSANTSRLFRIASKINPNTYHIESKKDIDTSWLSGKERVGISSGASTPSFIIEDIVEYLRGIEPY